MGDGMGLVKLDSGSGMLILRGARGLGRCGGTWGRSLGEASPRGEAAPRDPASKRGGGGPPPSPGGPASSTSDWNMILMLVLGNRKTHL